MMTAEQAAGYVSESPVLTWALTIATYNRADILPITLRLAAEQTVPPKEIIVVDASDDWERSRRSILEELATKYTGIAFSYLGATVKGTGAQKNQAISEATADIVFVFDDDTLMYPDCAEKILRAYEVDKRIVGVQATNLDEAPPGCEMHRRRRTPVPEKARRVENPAKPGILRSVRSALARFVHRHVLLRDIDLRFVPYVGSTYPAHAPLPSAAIGSLSPIPLMVGFKTTIRRTIVEKIRFDTSVRSASIEDLDTSYRASLVGPLLNANKAYVHHIRASSGRDSRRTRTAVSMTHLAMCIRRYAPNHPSVRYRFYVHWFRACVAGALNDLADREYRFPTLVGSVRAFALTRRAFRAGDHRLDEEFDTIARALMK